MIASLTGTLFSLATGVALAAYYTFNKLVTRAGSPLQIIFWIFAAHIPALAVWGALKYPLAFTWEYFLPGMVVLGLTVSGNLLAIRALSLSPFSLMMPVMCLSPVFTSLIGIVLLGEWPSATQWAGIILAVVGVLWLYAPPERPWDIFSFWAGFIRERGAISMALSALSWSLSAPFDKLSLRHADPPFHALFVFCGLVIFLFIWLTFNKEWETAPIKREFWGIMALTGVAGASADILQLLALQHMPAGPFEAIKRVVSQVLALALGYLLFHESLSKARMVGVGIICIGVPMIVL
ncbi:MAG: EamA family transporter [Alphaproteobacteria bacterium]|nr:EamA family transporter [Alphaproteobacteria bacterium]